MYIGKILAQQTDSSLNKNLNNKLSDKQQYPNFEKKYKKVGFIIKRGNDEKEFFTQIPLDWRELPEMITVK